MVDYAQKFRRDLNTARPSEEFIKSIVRTKYPLAELTSVLYGDIKFSDYDIEIPENKTGIEVKQDTTSKRTGNIAIEYAHKGKPSGINVTKAVAWGLVYWCWDTLRWEYCFVSMAKLWAMVKQCNQKIGGDGDLSDIYLLPVHMLVRDFSINRYPVSAGLATYLDGIYSTGQAQRRMEYTAGKNVPVNKVPTYGGTY